MTTDQAIGTRPLAVVLGHVDVPLQRAAEAAAQAGFTVYVPPPGADLRRDAAAQQALAALCSQSLDQTKILALYMQLRQRPALITTSAGGALLVSGFENSPPGPYPPAALTGMLKLHLRRRSPLLSDLETGDADTSSASAAPVPTVVAPAAPVPTVVAPAAPVPTVVAPAAPVPTVVAPAAPVPTVVAPAAPVPTTSPDSPIAPRITTARPTVPAAAASAPAVPTAVPGTARPLQQRTTPLPERRSGDRTSVVGVNWSQIAARAAIVVGAGLIIVAVFAMRGLLTEGLDVPIPAATAAAVTVPTQPAVAATVMPTSDTSVGQLPSVTAPVAQPRLQIELIAVEPDVPRVGEPVNIRLRVRNVGDTATQGPIWVDLYVNPNRTPNIGDNWDSIAENGTTWEVASLRPGEVRELTTLEADGSRSNFVAFLDTGPQQIFVQADTFGEAFTGADQSTAVLLGPQEVTVSNGTSQP